MRDLLKYYLVLPLGQNFFKPFMQNESKADPTIQNPFLNWLSEKVLGVS